MRLLKIIIVIFAIHFIRRFIEMYRAMKQLQEQQLQAAKDTKRPDTKEQTVINAEFKVMD